MSNAPALCTVRIVLPHEHEGVLHNPGTLLRVDAQTRDFLLAHKVIEPSGQPTSTTNSQE